MADEGDINEIQTQWNYPGAFITNTAQGLDLIIFKTHHGIPFP